MIKKSKIKKIISSVLAATVISSAFCTCSAAVVDGIYPMSANLYYYDTPTGKIVLKNVKSLVSVTDNDISSKADKDTDTNINNDSDKTQTVLNVAEKAKKAAETAEYTEIPTIEGGRFFKDGNKAAPEWINDYADREIWFLGAVSEGRVISIPYFKIIV